MAQVSGASRRRCPSLAPNAHLKAPPPSANGALQLVKQLPNAVYNRLRTPLRVILILAAFVSRSALYRRVRSRFVAVFSAKMKAVVSPICAENAVAAGKVTKHKQKDVENEEIQMYLSKLKDLVPFMPKNRKISKLEVIQHVIDYICDLQCALETHPAVNAFDAQTVLSQKKSQGAVSPRQPLGVRQSPNTILSPCEATIVQSITVS